MAHTKVAHFILASIIYLTVSSLRAGILSDFLTAVYVAASLEVGGLGGYKDEQATVTLLREHQI